MASTINSNIISINAQRNLALSGSSLAASMQRLSSGLRVNSAKDDAAGLVISERMNSQVRGFTVASRNANDGISLAQTAEGALGKVSDMLQRMRELAVQAGNATNSQGDRQALQAEVKQLSAEIDRVAKQTNFNGQKLLEGSFAGAVFQVGANSGDNITLGSLADTRASQLSTVSYANHKKIINISEDPSPSISLFNKPIESGALSIEIQSMPPLTVPLGRIEAANSSMERFGQIVEAINNKSSDTNIILYLSKQTDNSFYIEIFSSNIENNNLIDFNLKGFHTSITGISSLPKKINTNITLPIVNAANRVENAPINLNQEIFEERIQDFIKTDPFVSETLISGKTKFKEKFEYALNEYYSNKTRSNALKLSGIIPIMQGSHNSILDAKRTFDQSVPQDIFSANTYIHKLRIFENGGSSVPFPTYTNILEAMKEIKLKDPGIFPLGVFDNKINQKGVQNIDISTQSGTWIALKKIDSAIDQVNSARATLGAMQSRFENAVNNIDIQAESLSAARGRIVDADFAKETANLSRTQILQQAGTAMVAQANQIPQSVLQLLQR